MTLLEKLRVSIDMNNEKNNKKCYENIKGENIKYLELSKLVDYDQPNNYIVKSTNYNNIYQTPVLTAGQTFILGYTNEIDGIYKASPNNPVIIFDDFTTSIQWVDFNFKVKSSAMKILFNKDPNNTNLKFVFYLMKSINYTPSTHTRSWISKYSKIQVPVPEKGVQDDIVQKLDGLSDYKDELIKELNNEISARQKQYEYYRDKLLTFKEVGDESI